MTQAQAEGTTRLAPGHGWQSCFFMSDSESHIGAGEENLVK